MLPENVGFCLKNDVLFLILKTHNILKRRQKKFSNIFDKYNSRSAHSDFEILEKCILFEMSGREFPRVVLRERYVEIRSQLVYVTNREDTTMMKQ